MALLFCAKRVLTNAPRSPIAADKNLDLAVLELSALDRAAHRALLPGNRMVSVLLLDPVLHPLVEMMPGVVLADPGAVRPVRQTLPADVVGAGADMLAADDEVGPLRPLVTLVEP